MADHVISAMDIAKLSCELVSCKLQQKQTNKTNKLKQPQQQQNWKATPGDKFSVPSQGYLRTSLSTDCGGLSKPLTQLLGGGAFT